MTVGKRHDLCLEKGEVMISHGFSMDNFIDDDLSGKAIIIRSDDLRL